MRAKIKAESEMDIAGNTRTGSLRVVNGRQQWVAHDDVKGQMAAQGYKPRSIG